jgi:type I restriction enzyme S subunit
MTTAVFLQKFHQLAEIPNGVTKMRELAMELAVGGKLVEQQDDDGRAAQLLNTISYERKETATKMRTPPEHETSDSDEAPFQLPATWEWVRLGNIALQIQYGYTASADSTETDIRLLRITDIQNNRVDWPSVPGCQIELGDVERYLLSPNDILIARTGGTIGKSFIVPHAPAKSVFASYLIRVTPPKSMLAPYLKVVLESALYGKQVRAMSTGTGQPNINGRALGRLMIPVPPLAEQKRIVAKVDELMALCDRLEAQQDERETWQTELARASLARFTDTPNPANLNFLLHKSYDIAPADLRKTILTLAVQGRLVPQKPEEEPAELLLKQIEAHKSALSKDGKVRGRAGVPSMASEDGTFVIPSTWCWVRFGDIMINRDGERVPVSKEERASSEQTYDYYGASGVIDKIDDFLFDKPLLLIGEDGANLINRSTPIAFMARGKYWVNNHAHVLDGISEDLLLYVGLYINSTNLEPYVTGSAQPKMNQAKMNSIPVPLPPLAEQRRIAAKVDDLMALADELEAQLAASLKVGRNLLDAVVAELVA